MGSGAQLDHAGHRLGTASSTEGVPAGSQPEFYVDAAIAARFLSVAPKTLNQLAREGKIPAYPWGVGTQRRCWRFKLSELDSWMRSRLVSECHVVPNRTRT